MKGPRDDFEVGRHFLDACIGRRVGQRMAKRDDVVQVKRGFGETRIDAGDGTAIGLVAAVERGVARAVGERVEFFADLNQAGGERKLAAELVQLVKIMVERTRAL